MEKMKRNRMRRGPRRDRRGQESRRIARAGRGLRSDSGTLYALEAAASMEFPAIFLRFWVRGLRRSRNRSPKESGRAAGVLVWSTKPQGSGKAQGKEGIGKSGRVGSLCDVSIGDDDTAQDRSARAES